MKNTYLVLLVAVSCTLLTACETPVGYEPIAKCIVPVPTVPTPPGPALVGREYGMQLSPIPLDAVLFTDRGLVKSVAVQGIYASRNLNQSVQVTARILNCSDSPQIVKGRTSFLRSNQAPSEPTSVWKTVYMQPHSTAIYAENSITAADISNFSIEIAPDQ